MNKPEHSVHQFQNDFNCAQSILSVYAPRFGLDSNTAANLTLAFGGGMAQQGEICGAVSGALMVIGLKIGKIIKEDNIKRDYSTNYAKEYLMKFKKQNGAIHCKKLLGKDLSNPDELEEARERNLFHDICPKMVESSAIILDEILDNIDQNQK